MTGITTSSSFHRHARPSTLLQEGIAALDGDFPAALHAVRDNFKLLGDSEAAAGLTSLLEKDNRFTELKELLETIGLLAARAGAALSQSTCLVRELLKSRMDICVAPVATSGSSLQRQAAPIDLSRVVVVYKLSKLELDMRRHRLTREQVIEHYRGGAEDVERILGSHVRQKETLTAMQKLFPAATFIGREQFNPDIAGKASLVIALGGDNHLQWVSHHLGQTTPLLGINSDYRTSHGALLNRRPDQLQALPELLLKGAYRFEPWTRLEAAVDGRKLPDALCELFLGEALRKDMSRHTLQIAGAAGEEAPPIEQKGSGLLVSTGAGSTGWFKSACRHIYPDGATFDRGARYARFIVTEPSSTVTGPNGERTLTALGDGVLLPGQELIIKSLNDGQAGGVVLSDSESGSSFSRGSVARIRIAADPLWVIRVD